MSQLIAIPEKFKKIATESEIYLLSCLISLDHGGVSVGLVRDQLPPPAGWVGRNHQTIYQAILDVHDNSGKHDVYTVHQELLKIGAYYQGTTDEDSFNISHLMDYLSRFVGPSNWNYHRDIVFNEYLRRLEATDIPIMLSSGIHGDPLQNLENLMEYLEDILSSLPTRSTHSMGALVDAEVEAAEYAREQRAEANKTHQMWIPGITTGIDTLDAILGGTRPGSLYILGARPSMGKTALMNQIFMNAELHGSGIPHTESMEMSAREIVRRAICGHAGVSMKYFEYGLLSDEEMAKVKIAARDISNLQQKIDDAGAKNLQRIKSSVKASIKKYGTNMVAIDNLSMADLGDTRNLQFSVDKFTAGLKQSARETQVGHWLMVHLSREVENRDVKRPQMRDFRNSGGIEQNADVCISLYLPIKYYQPGDRNNYCKKAHQDWWNNLEARGYDYHQIMEVFSQIMVVDVLKGRNSGTASTVLKYDMTKQLITDWEDYEIIEALGLQDHRAFIQKLKGYDNTI